MLHLNTSNLCLYDSFLIWFRFLVRCWQLQCTSPSFVTIQSPCRFFEKKYSKFPYRTTVDLHLYCHLWFHLLPDNNFCTSYISVFLWVLTTSLHFLFLVCIHTNIWARLPLEIRLIVPIARCICILCFWASNLTY